MSDAKGTADTPKKKGRIGKLLMIGGGVVLLLGGGVGAGLYAAKGFGAHAAAPADTGPKLVPKSAEKRAGAGKEGGEGEGAAGASTGHGLPTPAGEGGDRYASTYYALDKEFTSNLQDSVHFVQVGVAISTPYDDKVIESLKTHEIAVRSAILMELGNTSEDQVFNPDGKKQLQVRLAKAINDTLRQKEGFGGVGNVYFTNFVVQ